MHKRKVGNTEVMLGQIGFGANAVGGHNIYGPQDEEHGRQLVRDALALGIDHIDTAYIYGPERSEVLIGEVLAELGCREQVVVATKGAHQGTQTGQQISNEPAFLRQCVEDSLRRLNTDYLDIFYIHRADETTPKYEAVGALQRLREEGKIRAIGVSNFSLEQLLEADRDGYVDVIQNQYNLIEREPERAMLPTCVSRQISFIPYFPLLSGLLTGKYSDGRQPDAARAAYMPAFAPPQFQHNIERVEQLRPVAEKHGCEIQHVALAWCLTRPAIHSMIPGAKSRQQMQSNLRTASVVLDQEDQQRIDAVFAVNGSSQET